MKLVLVSTFEGLGGKVADILDEDLSALSVICIPTAAYAEDDYKSWLEPEIEQVESRVARFKVYDIAGKPYEDVVQIVEGYDVVYVTGGNTYYLLEQMRACNFKAVLEQHFDQGNYYFGSSAGAIVTGPRIDFIKDLDDESKADLTSYEGLGLVDFLFIPHIDNQKFEASVQKICDEVRSSGERIVALRDDQAIYLNGSCTKIY